MDDTTRPTADTAVTLDDVARLAGVSAASVSRALNGREGVRPDVRERVRLLADSLGYRPNRAARTLASGRAAVLGLIVPSNELQHDPYGASIVTAVARAASAHDEGLMLYLAGTEPRRAVDDMVRDGLIDGVIVSAVAIGTPWVDHLLDAQVPTVLLGRHDERPEAHTISVENVDATYAAVVHVHEQGCRRVAHLGGRASRVDAQQRAAGYAAAVRALGLPTDAGLVVDGDFTRATGRAITPRLLEARPDAIVAANDESAIGAMIALRDAGLRVPEDVAVVGFDGTGTNELVAPTLTSVHQPFDAMSDLAVRSLQTLVGGGDVPLHQSVTPELVAAGSSLRTPRTTAPASPARTDSSSTEERRTTST